jgi:hypothetical protein
LWRVARSLLLLLPRDPSELSKVMGIIHHAISTHM